MAKTVTVKSGDTLSQILKDAGVSSYGSSSTWDVVAKASGLSSPHKIWAGNKITIPDSVLGTSGGGTTTQSAPTSAPEPDLTSSEDLTDYLNEQQQKMADLTDPDYDPFDGDIEGSIDEVIEEISGGEEMPEAPNYTDMFKRLREEYGLDALEQGINEYKNLIRQEENLLMQQRNDIRGGLTSMGVIEGRIDQATRDRMEMINWYKSNAQFLADMANSAYGYIEMVMNFEQLDYETAKERYDTNFNQRLKVYESIKQEAREERDFQYQLMMDQQKLALTNLTMYMDLISKGQLSWDDMSTAERTQMHKLEVQAGLPMGFLSRVRMEAGANIISTTTRTDPSGNVYVDMLIQQPDGSIKVESKLTGRTRVPSSGGGGGGGSTSSTSEADTEKDFLNKAGRAGTSEYTASLNALKRYGTFDNGMASLANPYMTEDQFYSAVDYLVQSQGVSAETAYYALEDVARAIGVTIK